MATLLSFRNETAMNHGFLKASVGLLCGYAAVLVAPAFAAEIYYQPIALISAETDSNVDLDLGKQPQIQGYVADLATIVGIDTPDSTTIIRPRFVYREYPKDSGDDRLEGYLDFSSTWRTQRSNTNLQGSYQHLDEFNAEHTIAFFDDITGAQPTPDTGRTVVGASRDSAVLAPKYTYSFTPIISGGVSGDYQRVTYSPSDDSSHLNFDFYQARAFATYSASPRFDWSFGGFGSQFKTVDADSRATGSGAVADFTGNWTPLLSTNAELLYQHTDINTTIPTPLITSLNKVGGSVDIGYKAELDRFHLIAKRSISPSGAGAVYTLDRIQLQYDRSFTERFTMTAALVGIRTHGLTPNLAGDDRKYAQSIIEAHYNLTRRFFVQGGYQYSWQRYQNDPNSASNNRIYVEFGYQGLGQQR
jgi:hypothetical protein